MQKRVMYWGTALLAAGVFGGTVFATAAAAGGVPRGIVAQQPSTPPTPTGMPGMEMGGMSMPDPTATVTDTMSGMDMSGASHDSAGHDMAGHDMGAVPSAGVPDAAAKAGAQPLDYVLDGDTKVFTLTAEVVEWPITEGVTMTAYSYNGMVPGPLLRVTEGDNVRIVLQNQLPEATTIHWHGDHGA